MCTNLEGVKKKIQSLATQFHDCSCLAKKNYGLWQTNCHRKPHLASFPQWHSSGQTNSRDERHTKKKQIRFFSLVL